MSSGWTDRLRRTFGLRIAIWYAGLFVGSAIVLVVIIYALLAQSLRARDRDQIDATLVRYVDAWQDRGLRGLHTVIERDRGTGRQGPLFVRVLRGGTQAVFFDMPADWEVFDLSGLPGPAGPGFRTWAELRAPGSEAALEVASVRLRDGTLFQVGKSTEARRELLARFRGLLLVVLASIVAIGLTGGAVLTGAALVPVRQLIAAVSHILRTGQLDARVPAGASGDAVDELARLFNAMLTRIGRVVAAMRESLDHVAHDLRTPIMRLRGGAESALRSAGSEEELRDALADCIEEADRVTALLDTLLDVAEAETGTMRLRLTDVDVRELVETAVDVYEEAARAKGLELRTEIESAGRVRADLARLQRVLVNLLDNAIKYTPPGGRVLVSAARRAAATVISVADTGPGIPEADLPRIWDRLYRGDPSRSERGLGLGLTLVKAMVEAHGGSVEVESRPGAGSRFTVVLPNLAEM